MYTSILNYYIKSIFIIIILRRKFANSFKFLEIKDLSNFWKEVIIGK